MITTKEIQAAKLSPTKKDFYQIWNELLDTSKKLSERWDPTSTNESDPGIVLLKVLTAIADKLNYNIDKNILEAFMPSATQEDSMRKLCDMMGYNIKYYQSATTPVTIAFMPADVEDGKKVTVKIDRFSNVKNSDENINYVTLEEVNLVYTTSASEISETSKEVECMQGQLCVCETDDNNIISLNHIDDNYRYYLPESSIAENGIFISNYNITGTTSLEWRKVDNLNTQISGDTVWKFGFDSKKRMPYIQFPDDISALIEDGLIIKYIRTNGINGNISPNTLTSLSVSSASATLSSTENSSSESEKYTLSEDQFSVKNSSAAMNGRNIETIDDAYTNYKKVIGTFDTLVTCRDYMNKIYQLYNELTSIPLVSNCIVSDIRDDINRAISLCSFNQYGICYIDKALSSEKCDIVITDQNEFTAWKQNAGNEGKICKYNGQYYKCICLEDGSHTAAKISPETEEKINHFDLMLYPFKTVYGLNTKKEFTNSFLYTKENVPEIEEALEDYKTISHVYTYPGELQGGGNEIVLIKNYLQLKYLITTQDKVNATEQAEILSKVYSSIYSEFNMRKLDFGEEIPSDSIIECIKNADPRIKDVNTNGENTLYTVFLDNTNTEYSLASSNTDNALSAKQIYNKLALRNILASRVELFNYDTSFKYSFTDSKYPTGYQPGKAVPTPYAPVYPVESGGIVKPIIRLDSQYIIDTPDNLELDENEVVSFRAPNFKTTVTYPGYVNYFIKLNADTTASTVKAIPATMVSFGSFITSLENDLTNVTAVMFTTTRPTTYLISDQKYTVVDGTASKSDSGTYYINFCDNESFAAWNTWIKAQTGASGEQYNGIYRNLGYNSTRVIGKMVDSQQYKYILCEYWHSTVTPNSLYFIQVTHDSTVEPTTTELGWTKDGLGRDAENHGITKNAEYQLKNGECLYINYTDSNTNDSETEVIRNICYIGTNDEDSPIIKPNFELVDSKSSHDTKLVSYSKTSGFDFSEYGVENPDGMFSLGSSEQIEIRERVKITLDKQLMYVYWTRKDNKDTFTFDESAVIDGALVDNMAYTLQDGEYFYYTNQNKADMAYYGSGTKIVRTSANVILTKNASSDETTSEEILTRGLAAVPWVAAQFSSTKKLELYEYQYINLACGDELVSLTLDDTRTERLGERTGTQRKIYWRKVANASYIRGDTTETLPKIEVRNCNWEVISKLEFNCGKDQVQTLHNSNKKFNIIEMYTYQYSTGGQPKPLYDGTLELMTPEITPTKPTGSTEYTDLSIKTNYSCISNATSVDTAITVYDADGVSVKEHVDDFKLKLYKENDLVITDGSSTKGVQKNTFGKYWTKVEFEQFSASNSHIDINADFDESKQYSLIMLYYNLYAEHTAITDNAYLTWTNTSSSATPKTPVIFNNIVNNTESWWSDYSLNAGLLTTKPDDWKNYYTRSATEPYTYTLVATWPAAGWSADTYYIKNKDNTYTLTATKPSDWGIEWYKNYYTLSGTTYTQLSAMVEWADNTYYWHENRFYLKPGVNVIKLASTCNLKLYRNAVDSDQKAKDTVVMSDIDIINIGTTNGLNISVLDYNNISETSAAAQLLKDINTADKDHIFYYNSILDNSTIININTTAGEKLSESKIYYDYNNVNNKFVISEIDAEYMSTSGGIQISNSSKK